MYIHQEEFTNIYNKLKPTYAFAYFIGNYIILCLWNCHCHPSWPWQLERGKDNNKEAVKYPVYFPFALGIHLYLPKYFWLFSQEYGVLPRPRRNPSFL